MSFVKNLIKLIIPKSYKKLPPGSYEVTIDKVIHHRNGNISLRLGNIKKGGKL